MGLYEMPLSMLGFGMGTMLVNFHMCGIMLVLRAVFNMLLRNASPRGPMCFRCLMVCCILDSVCELVGETIRDVFGCGCCFVAECSGRV